VLLWWNNNGLRLGFCRFIIGFNFAQIKFGHIDHGTVTALHFLDGDAAISPTFNLYYLLGLVFEVVYLALKVLDRLLLHFDFIINLLAHAHFLLQVLQLSLHLNYLLALAIILPSLGN